MITPKQIIELETALEVKAVFSEDNNLNRVEELSAANRDVYTAKIKKVVILNVRQFDRFTQNLLDAQEWLDGEGGMWIHLGESYKGAVMVLCTNGEQVLVDPSGWDYARYIGAPLEAVNVL